MSDFISLKNPEGTGSATTLLGTEGAAHVVVIGEVATTLPEGAATAEKQLPDGHRVRDQFTDGEILARQVAPSDTVLTFTFSFPVDILYIFSADHPNHLSSVDMFGGVPSAFAGIPLLPGVPQAFPVRTTEAKIFANAGGELTVWGYRYG